jgi:hypothetical protein
MNVLSVCMIANAFDLLTDAIASTGYPPFCSENPHQTYQKIIKWQDYLHFPDDIRLSREAEDLIRRYVATATATAEDMN